MVTKFGRALIKISRFRDWVSRIWTFFHDRRAKNHDGIRRYGPLSSSRNLYILVSEIVTKLL